ncbi:MAG: hypothetical protein RR393_05880 [Bacteroidales bacterium]
MTKAWVEDTAFIVLGVSLLKAKGFIVTRIDDDFNVNEYYICYLSENIVFFSA